MKILVTGGAGFIGSNLIKRLVEEKHTVHSLDNYSTGKIENEIPGCNYHTGDIENISLMDKDFDIIFHLAAISRIQPSFDSPEEYYRVNTTGTQKTCEFALQINAKLIYAGSSSRHYGFTSSPYATYKFLGEEIVKMYRKSFHLKADIARFYNVYGPNELVDSKMAAVIGIWRHQVSQNVPITVVGDGKQRRDFTHVDDIVDGLVKISNSYITHNDAWELGTGINYSINEVAEWFCTKFDTSVTIISNQKGNYRETLRENNSPLIVLDWEPKDRLKQYIESL